MKLVGRGLSYKGRLQQRVHCPECVVGLVAGSLTVHRQGQHGLGSVKSTPLPPQGLTGGAENVELGKGHQHSILCPFMPSFTG